jgi:hypothetical protein
MNQFLTEKYNPQLHNYFPIISEIVDDEMAAQIIEWQKDKVPIYGFYRHQLTTPENTYNFYTACADVIGFLKTKTIRKTNGTDDRNRTNH